MFLACMLVLGGDFLISQVHHGFSRHTSGRECAKTLYHSSVSCQIFSERIWRGTVDQRMQKTLHICVVVVVVVNVTYKAHPQAKGLNWKRALYNLLVKCYAEWKGKAGVLASYQSSRGLTSC
mmetsp:Transcript_102293/g.234559  ORF Transcript_102293/g.234559 Transcript_102293/m.234559 type:complete len:122 (+) Transcript_102293:1018-1383(+)